MVQMQQDITNIKIKTKCPNFIKQYTFSALLSNHKLPHKGCLLAGVVNYYEILISGRWNIRKLLIVYLIELKCALYYQAVEGNFGMPLYTIANSC